MTFTKLIRTVAKEELSNLLNPYAVTVAIEIAATSWSDEHTQKYGTELRDLIKTWHSQFPKAKSLSNPTTA